MFAVANGTSTIRFDQLSGWALPPESELRAGRCRPVRAFDTADQALDYIRQHGSTRHKRYRARQRRGAACVRLEVDPATVEALCRSRYLEAGEVANWREVEAALQLVITDWREQWR